MTVWARVDPKCIKPNDAAPPVGGKGEEDACFALPNGTNGGEEGRGAGERKFNKFVTIRIRHGTLLCCTR